VGRAADLEAIAELLAAEARLVTVTGPAGVGKTRLAAEVARRLSADRGAELWRADLGDARGVEGVCDAVALALGVQQDLPARADPAARIGRALAARGEVVLLLDELDALVEHAPATVGRWLALAPEVIFLVTSREQLRIPGEIVHVLTPLALPEGGAASGAAVELFVRVARRAGGSWTPGPTEAPYVAAIVRELDGLPLAIELCAPRLAVMGARALLHRLGRRFEVLQRGAAGRHATLEDAIDASWVALAPWERDALAQASVFRGGFTLEAAEAVLDLGAHVGAPRTLEVVAALRDKSLLHAFQPREAPGEIRLGLYASIRDFAARRLDPSATRAAEARHAAYTVASAEAWSKRLAGRDGPEMRGRILAERDNLLAVIERVLGGAAGPRVSARAAEPALRALLLLAPALLHEGALEAYVRLLDPVLEATRDSGADPRLLAHALALRGALRRQRGQARAGSRDLVRALATAETLGDVDLTARVTRELGRALASRGEVEAARAHFERALALYREARDPSGAGDALASLGALEAREGRLEEAEALLERALAVHRSEESPLAEAADLRALGEVLLDEARLDEARARLTAARQRARQIGDRRDEALAIGLLGRADDLAGDAAAARAAYQEAASTLRDLGFAPLEARFTGALGILCREEGKTAEAFTLLSAARDLLDADADAVEAGIFLAHLGALDAGVGRTEDAAQAFAAAHRKLARSGDRAALAVLDIARGEIGGARSLASRSAEVRLALRCFARASSAGGPEAAPPDDALLVGRAGQWFRPPRGERVPLDRRKTLALLLDRLARERVDRPGAALTWEVLLETAWPGERVLATAGAHRVRVAVSTLRKLGLKDVLSTREEGYLLAPEVATLRLH
jgi:predicted ATPase